jgi:cysteine desulfurase
MTNASQIRRIYLDHAATTPVDPAVKRSMDPYFSDVFGNPSSIHAYGQEALDAVETARRQVAALLHASPAEIVFTGGGTEADNAALCGVVNAIAGGRRRIVTSAVEHHAVLHCCDFLERFGIETVRLPVDAEGAVSPDSVEKAAAPGALLVSIMHANNEIGTVQPIAEIAGRAHARGALFHTDAVQTAGHLPIDVRGLDVDLLSLSGHKLYGPKGVGALFIRKGTPFVPLLHGGGQEAGRRSSTHNVPGIVGLGAAAALAAAGLAPEHARLAALRDRLRDGLFRRIEGVRLNGHPSERLANNLNLSFDGVEGESLVIALDLDGVAASTGSACGAKSGEVSHVLLALGLPVEAARGSLRLTLGRSTTAEDCDFAAEAIVRAVHRLRNLSSFGRRP